MRPNRAPFAILLPMSMLEIPEKCTILFPVENKPNSRLVRRNTAKLHLAQRPPKAFKSCRCLPYILPHPEPKRLPEREYRGRFFPE